LGFAPLPAKVYVSAVASTQEILFYDRYEGRLRSEAIYGEKPLRWAYETALGRLCLEGIIKHRWFSRLYGQWADSPRSAKEIAPFLVRFGVDPREFLDPVESFRTFNEFFFRRLRPEARPLAPGSDTVSFPADGRHLLVPDLSAASTIFAKGRRFDLPTLLGDADLAKAFQGGSAVISRLCPTDYHRFHFPLEGETGEPRLINGPLYSVNPIALARSLRFLHENKRRITEVRHPAIGRYLFLEIGATNVGGIVDTAKPGSVGKGEEKGYFRFGGSMVMTLFPASAFRPAADLAEQSAAGIELYARVGDPMGSLAG
jgi:phosphatidylserine decarboxylase